MKRGVCLAVLTFGVFAVSGLFAGSGFAVEDSAEIKKKLEAQKQEIRDALNGSSWMLELKPEAGGKTREDTLDFGERTVESQWLTKTGYSNSNYSVRFDGDLAVWETMQSKEGEGLAFWRGELHGETMYGTLSKQPQGGQAETFAFSATKIASAPPPAPIVAPATESVPTAESVIEETGGAPVVEQTPEPEKKKRGLW